jgi:hypothetical protein
LLKTQSSFLGSIFRPSLTQDHEQLPELAFLHQLTKVVGELLPNQKKSHHLCRKVWTTTSMFYCILLLFTFQTYMENGEGESENASDKKGKAGV